jgi:transposase
MDRASLEQLLGRGLSLAEIGRRFDLHEATVSYWVKKHGLEAVHGINWLTWSRAA